MPDAAFEFSAIRGSQFGREVFSCHVDAGIVAARFAVTANELPQAIREGRLLDQKHVAAWKSLLQRAKGARLIAPVVVAVDRAIGFTPIGSKKSTVGILRIPFDARMVVQSGRSIVAALRDYAETRGQDGGSTDVVAVTFYVERDAKLMQETFRAFQQRGPVSRTRRILASEMDPIARLARELSKMPPFLGLTEMHRATLAPRSRNLFTLSAVYLATRALLADRERESAKATSRLAHEFWQNVASAMPEWELVVRGQMTAGEVRANFLHTHGSVLSAIAHAGAALLEERAKTWQASIKKLRTIDWRRTNPTWEGRILRRGNVSKTTDAIFLTANVIKRHLGIALTTDDEGRELQHATLHPKP